MNVDQGAGEGGWLQVSPKWWDKCSRKETPHALTTTTTTLNLMGNFERLDWGGGVYVSGRCSEEILPTVKGTLEVPLRAEMFSLLQGPFGEGLREDSPE